MQLHFLILNSALTRSSFQPCSSSVYKGVNQISYCQKQSTLNNFEANKQFIIQTSQVSNVFVGVGQVQNSIISMQVEVPRYSSFSLFGQINDVTILESALNVTVLDETSQAASVCIQCNVQISYSNVTFVSSGQNASGLVIQPVSSITIKNCLFQLRLDTNLASGIVLVVSQTMDSFSITNFNLTSYFVDPSSNSGLVVSTPLVYVTVSISNFHFCSQYDILVGWSYYSSLVKTAYPVYNCDSICDGLFFVYGLCLNSLQSSKTNGKILTCGEYFEFDGNSCVCWEGYIFNVSQCISVVVYLTQLQMALITQTEKIDNLTNIVSFNQEQNNVNIIGNATSLTNQIQAKFEQLNAYISSNVSRLQDKITANNNSQSQQLNTMQTYLERSILYNISNLNQKITANVSDLDSRIKQNISNVYSNFSTLNSSYFDFKASANNQFTNIQSQFQVVNGNISSLNSFANVLQTNLTDVNNSLQSQINQLRSRLDQIQFSTNPTNYAFQLCLAKDNCQPYFKIGANTSGS
ncbi:Hypothetical_protein [Hexamita inflata]|uniref:Hypothetical_protein n=1 Tax=Hexamita inflata TaxID=28002 RepID=A0AA86TXH7_9EUKA|nr:Hypothetical protein HINF_LOCUS20204 [Hexamita inflata]